MRKHFGLIALFFCSTLSTLAMATGPVQTYQWDRNSALDAARSVDVAREVKNLSDINALADGHETIRQLKAIENRTDWPLPAREAAIYQYTRSLAGLPADAVSPIIIAHLRNYRPRVVVPHDDHPSSMVPLFNISGAAAGVEHGWQQAEFAFEAQSLLASNPAMVVSLYIESTNQNQRRAIIGVLRDARTSDVMAVQTEALGLLETSASLTALVAAAASVTIDSTAIETLLLHGNGPGLSAALMTIGQQASSTETARLLHFSITRAPAVNAGIAMAAWAPGLLHEADIRELMIDTLDNPELGAGAALILSKEPDVQTLRALTDTAAGSSVAARRAQMALDLNRGVRSRGMQP